MGSREELLSNCRLAQQVLCDCKTIDSEIAELRREIEVLAELTRKSIYENAHVAVNQDEFNERHSGYMERHQNAAERIASLEAQRRETNLPFQRWYRNRKLKTSITGYFVEDA